MPRARILRDSTKTLMQKLVTDGAEPEDISLAAYDNEIEESDADDDDNPDSLSDAIDQHLATLLAK